MLLCGSERGVVYVVHIEPSTHVSVYMCIRMTREKEREREQGSHAGLNPALAVDVKSTQMGNSGGGWR